MLYADYDYDENVCHCLHSKLSHHLSQYCKPLRSVQNGTGFYQSPIFLATLGGHINMTEKAITWDGKHDSDPPIAAMAMSAVAVSHSTFSPLSYL